MFCVANSSAPKVPTLSMPTLFPRPSDEQETVVLQRVLSVVSLWNQRIRASGIELTRTHATPQRSFIARVATSKQDALVKDIWTQALPVSDAVKAKYTPMLKQAVNEMKAYSKHTLKAAPEAGRKEAEEMESTAKIWRILKCPPSILTNFPKCALFLKTAGLLPPIYGFQKTSHDAEIKKALILDHDGHPLILMQGRWTRWEQIEQKLEYNKDIGKIVSKGNPTEVWNYYPSNPEDARFSGGLVPVERFGEIFSVHKMTPDEHQALKALGQKFYETNPERDLGVPKNCFLQIFTTRRDELGIAETPITANLLGQVPIHVGVRMVDGEGRVYSIGFEMDYAHSQEIIGAMWPGTVLATTDVNLASCDYDEFRNFNHRTVTTIPLTQERFQTMFDASKELVQANIRFNYIGQNCTSFAMRLLDTAGYGMDVHHNLGQALWKALPPTKYIPFIGPVLDKVIKAVYPIFAAIQAWTPSFVKTAWTWAVSVVFFIPDRISIIIRNLIYINYLGATKHTPVNRDKKHPDGYFGITNFQSLLSKHWTEVFHDKAGVGQAPDIVIQWQNAQRSTFVSPYKGPQMYLLPEADAVEAPHASFPNTATAAEAG